MIWSLDALLESCYVTYSRRETGPQATFLYVCVSSYYTSNTVLKNSLLDSFRPSWSPRSPSAWRELVCVQIDNDRHWYLLHCLFGHSVTSTTAAKDDERPVSRDDQRISKGTLSSQACLRHQSAYLKLHRANGDFRQSQKVEPISGISSEGYRGKGMVQSKPRKGGIPSDDE